MTTDRRAFSALVLFLLLAISAAAVQAQEEKPGHYAGRDADWWIAQLTDPAGSRAAVVALGKIGRPALEPLAKALHSEDRRMRAAALSALRRLQIDPTPVMSSLIHALDRDNLAFSAGILSLIRSTGRAALPHLDIVAPFVNSGHRDACSSALEILVNLKPESRKVLPVLSALARDGAPEIRRKAVYAALRIAPDSPDVVALLARALARANDVTRLNLLQSASLIRPDVPGFADLLAQYARDSSAKIRSRVATLLVDVVLEDRSRLDPLIHLLDDSDTGVRNSAAYALSKLETIAIPAVAALTKLLGNPEPGDDLGAVLALTAIGPEAGGAQHAVLQLLDRPQALPGMLERAAAEYVALHPSLAIRALERRNEPPRRIGMQVLHRWSQQQWKTHLDAVLAPLERALFQAEDPVGYEIQALVALRNHVVGDGRATLLYLSMAKAASSRIRKLAAEQLALRPEAIPQLLELLGSEDASDREFAFRVFMVQRSALRVPGAWEGLFGLLRGENSAARDLAGRVLLKHFRYAASPDLKVGDARAFARAAAALLADEQTSQHAVSCLAELGSHAVPYIDDLFALLGHEGPYFIGGAAASALCRIAASGELAALRVIPRLESALEGDNPVAAAAAACGLVWGKQHDDPLLARLPNLIRDPRPTVHHLAVRAAGNMADRGKALLPALLEVAENPPEGSHVQWVAIQALSNIAPGDERLLRIAVARLLRSRNRGSEVTALLAGRGNAAKLLAEALPNANTEAKLRILSVLGSLALKGFDVSDQLRPLLEHPDAEVRRAVALLLEHTERRTQERQD